MGMNPPDDMNKIELEQLITLIKEVMPHPAAEGVIATCLIQAGLSTAQEALKAADIKVSDRKDSSWDDMRIEFSIDGVEMYLEVRRK